MARRTRETIAATLTAAKAAGQISNVEFTAVREAFGRHLDEIVKAQRDAAHAALWAAGVERNAAYDLVGDFICSNYTNLKGRIDRMEKACRAASVLGVV